MKSLMFVQRVFGRNVGLRAFGSVHMGLLAITLG